MGGPAKGLNEGQAAYDAARRLHEAGQLDDARTAYFQALKIHPKPAAIYHDLGVLLRAMDHPRAAIACYRRALTQNPSDPDTWTNLGNAQREIFDFDGALNAFSEALSIGPETPEAHINVGLALYGLRAYEDACAAFKHALALDRDNRVAQLHLGLSQLHLSEFKDGFRHYEARLEEIFQTDPTGGEVAPIWDGTALKGRHLLIQSEQGLGDILQFSRFLIPLTDRANGPVFCEAPKPLLRLFQASFPTVTFFEKGEPAPPHDLFVALGSLPHRLGVDAAGLVQKTPYLTSDETSLEIPDKGRLKVGITWSGNRTKLDRSCPFEDFMQILEVDGIDFYSFQRGTPVEDIKAHGAEGLLADLSEQLDDFADDAACLRQMDLVISIDTSFCHVAGAMGVPTWVLLTEWADWRFLIDGETTPWYPSFRLFRPGANGGWPSVVSDAQHQLLILASQHQ